MTSSVPGSGKKAPKMRAYDMTLEEACGKLGPTLREWGVAVVKDVFPADRCEAACEDLVSALETLSGGKFDRHHPNATWDPAYLPSMPRSGLMQAQVGFKGSQFRGDPIVRALFRAAYSDLRGRPVTDTVSSLDGVNIRPPIAPFYDEYTEDWPHIDASHKSFGDLTRQCIQAQVVLSDTSAAFRCSPKSHLKSDGLMDPRYGGREQEGDWTRLKREHVKQFADEVRAIGGTYQTPVHTPRGSMIFWLSNTVHSAIVQRQRAGSADAPAPAPASPLANWRFIVYVCHVPRDEVDDEHIWRLHWAWENNRVTNHNGRRVFDLEASNQKGLVRDPEFVKFIRDPKLVYSVLPPPTDADWVRDMLGVPTTPSPPGWAPRGAGGGRGRGGGGRGRGGGGTGRGGGGGSSGAGGGAGRGTKLDSWLGRTK
jgi:uncharacterized membrane protein YgcG